MRVHRHDIGSLDQELDISRMFLAKFVNCCWDELPGDDGPEPLPLSSPPPPHTTPVKFDSSIVTRCWEPESRKRPDSLAGDTVTVSVVTNKLYDAVVTGGGADGGGGDERLKMLSSPLLLGART
uniref:Uncharacterized protein n=1 Tax=Glossina austeni TaxID=7395 RepID=A0A1A9UUQ7_GLOAU